MRACLETEFTEIFHLDLKGNARTSGERRRQEGGNVFDDAVRVSVGITFFLKNTRKPRKGSVSLFRVEDAWRAEEKRGLLDQFATILAVPIAPASFNLRHAWITEGIKDDFEQFIPIARDRRTREIANTVFEIRSLGLNTNRDQWVYNFREEVLQANLKKTIGAYNAEVRRWQTKVDHSIGLDSFVDSDQSKIKWSSRLKEHLLAGSFAEYDPAEVRTALYRPFSKEFVYLDQILNQRRGNLPRIFPINCQNSILVISDIGARSAFSAMAADCIVDLHLSAGVDGFQCFPFYAYDEDGSNRRENITDWSLNEFRTHYSDPNITKWDIFHYVYAVLHHPEYRERYAANLKRELPRIPFVASGLSSVAEGAGLQASRKDALSAPSSLPKASAQPKAEHHKETAGPSTSPEAGSARDDKQVFWRFAKAGAELAELHVNYEQQIQYPLERVEKGQLNWRVEKMRLGKDKASLTYNDFLTLRGIPPETYEYRLGNRSALEWVIDQYQVSTDKRSGITNDPNRADDPEYIARLIGQVITVSLETMKIVKSLPALVIPATLAARMEAGKDGATG